jgi:aspartyl aminopeptidase
MKLTHINDLMKFLDASPTSYQAAEQLETRLLSKGFTKLDETQEWNQMSPALEWQQRTWTVHC